MVNDLRYAFGQVFKRPGFTGVTILTIGLGIATVTVVFSLINTLYFQMLPVREPSRLHDIFAVPDTGSDAYQPFSYPNYADYRDRNDVFDVLLAQSVRTYSICAWQTESRPSPARMYRGIIFQSLACNLRQEDSSAPMKTPCRDGTRLPSSARPYGALNFTNRLTRSAGRLN